MKIKTFALQKTLLSIQKTSTDWKKVFASYIYNKAVVSKMHKLSKLKIKKLK